MDYERKEFLNAMVEFYSISFTEAEKFLEKFPTFVEIKKAIEPIKLQPETITFNSNAYENEQLKSLLKDWSEILKREAKRNIDGN